MNMCGLHTKTIFNTKFLEIPDFCVNTHTLSLTTHLPTIDILYTARAGVLI